MGLSAMPTFSAEQLRALCPGLEFDHTGSDLMALPGSAVIMRFLLKVRPDDRTTSYRLFRTSTRMRSHCGYVDWAGRLDEVHDGVRVRRSSRDRYRRQHPRHYRCLQGARNGEFQSTFYFRSALFKYRIFAVIFKTVIKSRVNLLKLAGEAT